MTSHSNSRYAFITEIQFEILRANGLRANEEEDFDPMPVLKLFTPDAGATWLLTFINPEDLDVAWGLCDLGLGTPEVGSVRLSELDTVRGMLNLPIEQDKHFHANKRLSGYARIAMAAGRIQA